MSTERLDKITVPKYSSKQEKFNSISHFLGVPFGVFIIIFAITLLAKKQLPLIYFIGLMIFGATIVLLYLVSGLYHICSPDKIYTKRYRRIIDHCTIYALIAGTYTPICLYIATYNVIGYIILTLEWALAIIGVILNYVDLNNKVIKIISMVLYLALGWMIIFTPGFLYLPTNAFIWILVGGILYTIGSITYGIGHKKLNFHGIFHVFVLLGTIIQGVGVLLLFI